MTDKKFTDEEIIKALKCCLKSKTNGDCATLNCPCFKDKMCIFVDDDLGLQNYALDLINRQKAEIEKLKGSIIVSNIMESQRIKREAYKEFANKVKQELMPYDLGAFSAVRAVLKDLTGEDTNDLQIL